MKHPLSRSWRWALIGVWLIGALLVCAPVHIHAANKIAVSTNTATSDFPHGIDFRLQANSTATITRVALLYSLADSLTEQLETPAFDSGNSVDVTEKADFASSYVPTGINVTYHWRIEDASGASHETDPQTILWKDDRFTWNSVSGDYVTIYSYKASIKFQNYMLTLSEKYVASEMELYGIDTLVPINIWIYETKEDFNGTLEPNSQEWAAGSALPAFQLIQEIIADGDDYEANRLIPHELSHQILHQATENPFGILPLWLDEGLAVTNENVDHRQYESVVTQAKKAKALVSIRALISEFPIDSSQASLAYAESYSIVTFIRTTYGDDKLLAFLKAFKDEVTIDQALKQVYGFDQDGLETAWLASIDDSNQRRGAGATINSTIGELLSGGTLILLTAAGIAGVHHLRNARRHRAALEFADSNETIGVGW